MSLVLEEVLHINLYTGKEMRTYLWGRGIDYLEMMIFQNYYNGLDIYTHKSTWPATHWNYYVMDDIAEPTLWHTELTMRYVEKKFYTIPNVLQGPAAPPIIAA